MGVVMQASDLYKSLRDKGFTLRLDGKKLLVSPASRLSVDERESISSCKSDLISILADISDISNIRPDLGGSCEQKSTNFSLNNPDGDPTPTDLQRRPARPVHRRNMGTVGAAGGLSVPVQEDDRSQAWDDEMVTLREWIKTASLPASPFRLSAHELITNSEGYRAALLLDFSLGPSGWPPYRINSLRTELKSLKSLCEHLSVESEDQQK